MKLKQYLRQTLPVGLHDSLIQGYDIVGDMAITIIPDQLIPYETLIGEAILAIHKNIHVVAKRDGTYTGRLRTIPLSIIAGENRKQTLHKEFGIKLLVNPEQAYFSPRTGTERKRIADLVQPGEDVLVMFSGVGPFPLMVAKHSEARTITGIELNRTAHEYAVKNVALNKEESRVTLFNGDVEDILPHLAKRYDRIIMPLPGAGRHYVPLALSALNTDGALHLYDFQSPPDGNAAVRALGSICRRYDRRLVAGAMTVCGHTGPSTYRICVDGRIR